MIKAIANFFKALFTVIVGLLILAVLFVVAYVIFNLFGLEVEFIDNIAVWILSRLSKGLVWLYNIIVR